MLRQLYIFLFILILLSCKNDSMEFYSTDVNSITGKWKLVEVEKGTYGQKYWESVAASSAPDLIFGSNGAVVDSTGMAVCCGPTSLIINKQLYKIEPNKSIAPNPVCALVNCAPCVEWEIEWQGGNEMIVQYCNGSREKYRRN